MGVDLQGIPVQSLLGPAVWAIDSRCSQLGNYLTRAVLPAALGDLRPFINQKPARLRPEGGLLPFVLIGTSKNVNVSLLRQLLVWGAQPFATCCIEVGDFYVEANIFGAALLSTDAVAFERLFKHVDPGSNLSFYQICVRHQEACASADVSVCPRGFASILHVFPALGNSCTQCGSFPSPSLTAPLLDRNAERVRWIIEHAEELRLDLNAQDSNGRAFIHLCHHPSEFEALLRSGCACAVLDGLGRTALECAVERGRIGLAIALYNHWPSIMPLPARILLATTRQAWAKRDKHSKLAQWKKLASEMYQHVPAARFEPIDKLDEDAVLWYSHAFSEPDPKVRPLPWARCKYYEDKTLFEAILELTAKKIEVVRGLRRLKVLLQTPEIQAEDLVSSKDGPTALHVFAEQISGH